jgi:hypothetical protein
MNAGVRIDDVRRTRAFSDFEQFPVAGGVDHGARRFISD